MRRFLPLLLLAACSPGKPDQTILNRIEAEQRSASDEGQIVCANVGEAELRRDCLVERSGSPDGLILTIRHPDGAFRRLLVTRDGRGVVAADGAERAIVRVTGPDRIEVTIAGERYELPATVKGAAEK